MNSVSKSMQGQGIDIVKNLKQYGERESCGSEWFIMRQRLHSTKI